MYATVDIDRQQIKTTILIRPKRSAIFKIALVTMTIIILIGLLFIIGIIIAGRIHKPFEIASMLGVSLILFIFIYKHLRGAFRKELLTIENKKISYNNSFLGLGKYYETKLNDIKAFKYVGYSQQTKHPLDIKGDALGFGTQEGEINYLNQIGTMILVTEFDVLKFGVDVDEEDYFKIKHLLD
jgi:hypothetical protein